MLEYIEIGVITNTHGTKGHVKVMPLTDYPERFKKMKTVLAEKNNGDRSEYEIEEVKYFKNMVILKFKDIIDMNAAEKLKGYKLIVHRKDAVKLPEDTYFIFDLINCEVYEDGEFLGYVKDVIVTGSNDVYIVEYNGKEILIPALGWVVLSVDIDNKRIEVRLPEGLRDL